MKSYIAEPLGLYGYKELEPVFLSALVSEKPLLLIGRHGTGKSQFLERLSKALNKEFRHYNASLLNYDDLVGIPYPDEERKSLHYIYEKSAIWEAETVFFDEINRTRPDLQNKLFPIINEKMVQGKRLEKLVYRFAAMNPPYLYEDMGRGYGENEEYGGVSELDIALADRFAYLSEMPEFGDLDEKEKEALLEEEGEGEFPYPLSELILMAKKELFSSKEEAKANRKLFFLLISLLEEKEGYLSSRRVRLLYEGWIEIHASRRALFLLEGEGEPNIRDSLLLALENCLPYVASSSRSKGRLLSLLKEAERRMEEEEMSLSEKIFLLPSIEERLLVALEKVEEVEPEIFSRLLSDALSSKDKKKNRALALLAYEVLKERKDISSLDMVTIMSVARPALEPSPIAYSHERGERVEAKEIRRLLSLYEGKGKERYRGLLISFLDEKDPYDGASAVDELSSYYLEMERRVRKNG